jgi:hypothetical protein
MNKERMVNVTLWLFLVLSFFYVAYVFAGTTVSIKAPVANMLSEPSSNADVISQAIYGTTAVVMKSNDDWSLVNTPDGYHGWVSNNDIIEEQSSYPSDQTVKIITLSANVYPNPDTSENEPLFALPFDTRLQLLGISADKEWYKVGLVDGGEGYIEKSDAEVDHKNLSMQETLTLSKQFLNIPYLWGGVSSFGYDCSGFVQMLFKQMGILIPRDTNLQVKWRGFVEVAKENPRPGDVLFFGWYNKISHVGIYLGNDLFINSTAYQEPMVKISNLTDAHWQESLMAVRRLNPKWLSAAEFKGSVNVISSSLQKKMLKYTWREGCPVAIDNLAAVKFTYFGFDNKSHQGSLIVNKDLAPEVLDIFAEIYAQRFPIEKIKPIEQYKGDDNASMQDDNTSAFNCRAMTDFPDQYSIHSYGSAIDINPIINPYVNGDKVEPEESAQYADRSIDAQGKITPDDIVYYAFTSHGWQWGGDWENMKDYQHFEKPLSPSTDNNKP